MKWKIIFAHIFPTSKRSNRPSVALTDVLIRQLRINIDICVKNKKAEESTNKNIIKGNI